MSASPNHNLVDEMTFVIELLNDALPGGTSSSAVMEAAVGLMLVRRLDLILAEAAKEGGDA